MSVIIFALRTYLASSMKQRQRNHDIDDEIHDDDNGFVKILVPKFTRQRRLRN